MRGWQLFSLWYFRIRWHLYTFSLFIAFDTFLWASLIEWNHCRRYIVNMNAVEKSWFQLRNWKLLEFYLSKNVTDEWLPLLKAAWLKKLKNNNSHHVKTFHFNHLHLKGRAVNIPNSKDPFCCLWHCHLKTIFMLFLWSSFLLCG